MSSAPEGLGEQSEVRRGRATNRGAGVTATRKESRAKGGDGSRGKQSQVPREISSVRKMEERRWSG